MQHLKRAVCQEGHCWGQAFEVAPDMTSPIDWGWTNPLDWRPLWSILHRQAYPSFSSYCKLWLQERLKGPPNSAQHCVNDVEEAGMETV